MSNAIYAQSGGVTAVINASAFGVISKVRANNNKINKLFAAKDGILGVLNEELFDTDYESNEAIESLKYTPGGAFGSCRYKLKSIEENKKEYLRIIDIFKAHDIGYFFYNGGNDSADTCLKVAKIATELSYPIKAIHIPKTIDNDLVVTDNCPGFGSVAKYIAVSIKEAGLDLASMFRTSTKVFVMEVMGRHAGWIAASSALANKDDTMPPHIILFPEIIFNEKLFLNKVEDTVKNHGYCVIVVSEGIKNNNKELIGASDITDAFGHKQLGGVAIKIVSMIKNNLNFKCHYAVSDYLQRSARHIASEVDIIQAIKLGEMAVEYALKGHHAIMPYIKRVNDNPYKWDVDYVDLNKVANFEKSMPRSFISEDGFYISDECRRYLQPLIEGESYPPYENGIPVYTILKKHLINKKLPLFI